MSLDQELLLWVNRGWARPALDALMGWVSQKGAFSFPLVAFLGLLLTRRWGRDGLRLWGLLVLAVLLGDGLGNLLKHLTGQLRPCAELGAQVRLVDWPWAVGCSRKPLGMPSNHALNFFLAAAFLGTSLRSWAWGLALGAVAGLVALSRVYLGVHYPSQVLAGAVLGLVLGAALAALARRRLSFLARMGG